jgi:NMD protein affecting ribosome stability and mRNA decay
MRITVKCVCCGWEKEIGEEQREQPMCDKCYSPMIVEEVKQP